MSQPTLFKFFGRTPKASNGSPSAARPSPSPSVTEKKLSNGNSTPKTPKSSKAASTPVSSRNGTGTGQKRRRTSGHSSSPSDQTPSNSSPRKKLRNEDSPNSSEGYSEGSLVWALLDGYPWWPAMIRGVEKGGPISRKESLLEFHVQFFDKPPSRAWMKKGNLKPYIGSQNADIPPTKTSREWMAACKVADEALSLDAAERVEKYWHDFSADKGNEDDDEIASAEEVSNGETPKSRGRNKSAKKFKRVRQLSSSSEEEDDTKGKKSKGAKQSGKISNGNKSNSDDDEYSPTKDASMEEDSDIMSVSEAESEEMSNQDEDMESDEEKQTKAKSRGKSKKAASPVTPKAGTSRSQTDARNQLQKFKVSDSPSASPKPASNTTSNIMDEDEPEWEHLTLTWAKEGNRTDARRRKETDPDYDPRTLFVPLSFLDQQTPAMRQWWEFKMKNFDTILFFKLGKFYEIHHWDACIAVKELGITFMKGKYAHCGFPEISYTRFANALVEKGYKVARIEQTETPSELDERIKKTRPSKKDRVIRRELCQISTKGVRYASFQDDTVSSPFGSQSAYLYAIVEKQEQSGSGPVFGVCFIDTTIGIFHLGQFQDDRHLSRLRTLFAHHVPVQILHEKGKLSASVQQLFFNMSGVRKDPLVPDSEFWGAKKVLKFLAEQDYLRNSDGSASWPPTVQQMLSESDHLGLTPDENWELGVKSLGGIVYYLQYCLLDHDLLSQKRFELYKPVDLESAEDGGKPSLLPDRCFKPKYMVLDGITMRNLEILEGPLSLLSIVDKCGTNFGKRLLRHWLCLPLALPEDINERLDAVQELMDQRDCRGKILLLLKTLPDLERILTKIHYLGSSHRSKNHPDGRANFFEEIKYSKNKIADLLSTLKGFKTCVAIMKELKRVQGDLSSKFILQLINDFPENVEELLTTFDKAFDHEKAAKDGKIIPKVGLVEDYDMAVKVINDIKEDADKYLRQLSKELGTQRIAYFGNDKKRFQIEVPENVKVPKEFEMTPSKKGFKRYVNSRTKKLLSSMMQAEAERDEVLRDITRKIFEKFDTHRNTWSQVVECIGTLDVLISLSLFSESQEGMCRPSVSFAPKPFINVVEGRHPCLASDSYIPNDTALGLENEDGSLKGNFVILTGPNMGGKSTLMRQVGLLTILSHLGCFVPAEKCEMSVVDRIFTRLGANDNIGEGESTFYVEMSETSAILKHATSDSLLLIDELGRGTATYDGTAIAYATAKELSARNCRAVFSTHYHTLVESLQEEPSIQMTHMACMIENENEEDPTQESITFLYKMISGPCPKSYGFNAARLAGICDKVVRVAHKKAKEFETVVTGIRTFTSICSSIRAKTFSMEEFAALKI